MPRTYTERAIVASHAIKAADLNVEAVGVLRQINGGLDQHQIPLGSIVRSMLVAPSVVSNAYPSTDSTYLAANSYHVTTDKAVDEDTPEITIDPSTEATGGGWRTIAPLQTSAQLDGTVLEFISREGMLAGAFAVDVERRISYVRRTEGGVDTYPFTHESDWIQFGIFLNGSIIADSGQITPRRLTLDLPFACPAPSGYCRLDLRFRANTVTQIADGTVVAGVTWSYPSTLPTEDAVRYPPILFYGTTAWCRNQYR